MIIQGQMYSERSEEEAVLGREEAVRKKKKQKTTAVLMRNACISNCEQMGLTGAKGSYWGVLANEVSQWNIGLPTGCGIQVRLSPALGFSCTLCIMKKGESLP